MDKTGRHPASAERATAVEWVHAWGAGQSVVLTSDEERLEARGNDLFHDAKARKTTLKGAPEMVAAKDTHEIHAPELILFGADSTEGQQAEARGPGYLRLNNGEKRGAARWKTQLVYRKEDGLERITLTGNAQFEDLIEHQSISGERIKIVLVADPPAAGPRAVGARLDADRKTTPGTKPAEADAGSLPNRRAKSVEVDGHVVVRSPELVVNDADHLVMLFTDVPAPAGPVPPTRPADPLGAAARGKGPLATPGAPAPGAAASEKPAPPTKKPFEVRAGKVQAHVKQFGKQYELESVFCEDKVWVHQDPPTPQEKPIDMTGRTLQLEHTREGNRLLVLGTLQEPAEVNFPELSLFGPRVRIDQIDNVAEVEGIGGMRLDSQTGFQGEKLQRPVPLLITWKQKMHFDGQLARFHGNVEATQGNTSVLCNSMQVELTRPVSLAQAPAERKTPGNQPATVEKVICDQDATRDAQPVSVTESEREGGRLKKYKRIDSTQVEMYKDDGKLFAARGEVRLLQLGPKGQPGQLPGAPAGKPANAAPAEEEYKLTWVRYTGKMIVDDKARTVKFWDNVNVVHLPSDDPGLNLKMDHLIVKLPASALHVRSRRLEVYTAKTPDGKAYQTMVADGEAFVNWQNEFTGRADIIRFDESKQQLILDGTPENPAVVNRTRVRGGAPGVSVAKKFTYNRLTDSWIVEEARIIDTGPIRK